MRLAVEARAGHPQRLTGGANTDRWREGRHGLHQDLPPAFSFGWVSAKSEETFF